MNGSDYLGNLKLGDLLNPFSGNNPFNPFSSKSLKALGRALNPITPFRSTRNFLSPWLRDPFYYQFPDIYKRVWPTTAGIVVGAIVTYFTCDPELGAAIGGAITAGSQVLMNGGSVRDSTVAAAIGFATGYITSAAVEGIKTAWVASHESHLQWYQVDWNPDEGEYNDAVPIQSSSITGVKNISINGMRNSLQDAITNGENFYLGKSFILGYSPQHGAFADIMEAAFGIVGKSSEASDLATVLGQIDPNGSTLFLHSRGAIVGIDALMEVAAKGVSLQGLTVSAYGGAMNVFVAKSAVASVQATWGNWTVNAFDLVPNIVGGDALIAPWKILTSIVGAPFVIHTGPNSPHSSWAAIGENWFSQFNVNY